MDRFTAYQTEILIEAKDDWCRLENCYNIALEYFNSREDVVSVAAGEIVDLISNGLIDLGELSADCDFVAYSLSDAAVKAFVAEQFLSFPAPPYRRLEVWICITAKGRVVVDSIDRRH